MDLLRTSAPARYLTAAALALAAVALRWAMTPLIGTGVEYLTLFPAVMCTTVVLGPGPGLLATVGGVLAVEYWLIPPAGLEVSLALLVRAAMVFFPALFLGRVNEQLRTSRDEAEQRAAEAKAAEEAASELARRERDRADDLAALARLHDLSTAPLGEDGAGPLLQRIMDAAVDMVRADRGTLQLVEGDTLLIVAHHAHQPPFLEFFTHAEDRSSACGAAAQGGKRVVVPDVESSPLFAGTPSLAVLREAGVRAVQSTPLVTRAGRLLGILTTHWGIPYQPDEHDLWRLDLLARQAADLIESAQDRAALLESEERQRLVSDNLPDSAVYQYVHEADGRVRFLYFSQGVERLNGVKVQDVLRDPLTLYAQVLPEYLGQLLENEKRSAASLSDFDMEVPMRVAGGNVRWMRLHSRPRRTSDGRVVWDGVQIDVTDRKLSEEALRASEQRLVGVLESMPDAFVSLDADLRYTYVNANAERLQAARREELLGKDVRLVYPDAESYKTISQYERVLLEQKPLTVTSYHAGFSRWVEIRAFPIPDGVSVFYKDVSTQVKAERALRESEARLRLALEAGELAAWEYEPSSGRVTITENAGRVLALSPEESLDNSDTGYALIHPEDVEGHRSLVEEAIRSAGGYVSVYRQVRGTEVFWLEERGRAIADESGRTVRLVGVTQNITARVRAQDELRQAKEEADRANRAKSEFLARMSHEIRTPMNGIMGMTELVLMNQTLPQRDREFLAMAKQSAGGLLEIINDILDIARIEAGRVELEEKEFDLERSLGYLLAPLRVAAEQKGLSLTLELAAGLPARVTGDEGRLRQVLTNLVGNAVKFSDRGSVAVSLGPYGTAGRAGRRTLLFAVRDQGIGIPEESLSTIFDSFSAATRSTHARYGGTGLGLSIAKQLVELMGGRIWVESEVGRGSVFSFTIELRVPTGLEAAEADEKAVHRLAAEGGLRVLVAEDNPLNQVFASELLRTLGHAPFVVPDGEAALRALSEEKFDLVLMDVQMPRLDGDEATRRIRAGLVSGCPCDIPIVALTAHALEGDRERLLSAGMDDYLSKPFAPADVATVLARLAGRRS